MDVNNNLAPFIWAFNLIQYSSHLCLLDILYFLYMKIFYDLLKCIFTLLKPKQIL